MFKNDWESKWKDYSVSFAENIKKNEQNEWINHFLQSSILLTNISMSSLITFVQEFKFKISEFNPQQFEKKLFKLKRSDIEYLIKFFLMDYLTVFSDNPENLTLLENRGISLEAFEELVMNVLKFNKKEKEIFKQVKKQKETMNHSIQFLELLRLGKDAKNAAIVEGIELIKEEIYKKFDHSFQKFIIAL